MSESVFQDGGDPNPTGRKRPLLQPTPGNGDATTQTVANAWAADCGWGSGGRGGRRCRWCGELDVYGECGKEAGEDVGNGAGWVHSVSCGVSVFDGCCFRLVRGEGGYEEQGPTKFSLDTAAVAIPTPTSATVVTVSSSSHSSSIGMSRKLVDSSRSFHRNSHYQGGYLTP